MKTILKTFTKWLKEKFCTNAEQAYLNKSVDTADFEYRLRVTENRLSHPKYNYLPIYFS